MRLEGVEPRAVEERRLVLLQANLRSCGEDVEPEPLGRSLVDIPEDEGGVDELAQPEDEIGLVVPALRIEEVGRVRNEAEVALEPEEARRSEVPVQVPVRAEAEPPVPELPGQLRGFGVEDAGEIERPVRGSDRR